MPDISVVMGVYNGAVRLPETMESILAQEGTDFELIVVDDGSTDNSSEILDNYARHDLRVKVIHQDNHGLTRALMRGCTAARGEYIARHDARDVSTPDRLVKQLSCIRAHADAALVSCGTRFVGPSGEFLYTVAHDPSDATDRLLTLTLYKIRGPSHHGSTIFSRSLYEKVGGYRSAFYFAQDLDLWIRMAEHGKHVVMPEVLYQAVISAGAISGLYRKKQIETTRIIFECTRLRRLGMSELPALVRAQSIRPACTNRQGNRERASAFYFIGSNLRRRGDPRAAAYLKQAIALFPFHAKAWWRLLIG